MEAQPETKLHKIRLASVTWLQCDIPGGAHGSRRLARPLRVVGVLDRTITIVKKGFKKRQLLLQK